MTLTRASATVVDYSVPGGDETREANLKVSNAVDNLIEDINAEGFGVGDMLKADNLSGLANTATAQTNLGISAFAQTILDDADAAAVRSTIGAGDLLASNNLSDVTAATARSNLGLAIGADVQAFDADILKADTADLLQAVYGDEAQTHTGTATSGITITRNHVKWTLTDASTFDDMTFPYDGTYVFHVYPGGETLTLSASYKSDGALPDPDSAAGEIRITVEQFNSRKTIVNLQNMEA